MNICRYIYTSVNIPKDLIYSYTMNKHEEKGNKTRA